MKLFYVQPSKKCIDMIKSSTPKKIGLLGPFGFGNLGDAALQQSMIQHIRKHLPDAQIYGYSLNPRDTEARHQIPTFPLTRTPEIDFTNSDNSWKSKKLPGKIAGWFHYNSNPTIRKLERVIVRVPAEVFLAARTYHHLKGLDILIFSGSGQLNDLWGGPWKLPYILFKFSLLARLRNVKVMFVSVGLESVRTSIGKFFIKVALAQASYKSFRDKYTKDCVEQMKLDSKLDSFVYPDLAHSLDIEALVDTTVNSDKRLVPVVGLNLVSFYDPRYWPLKDTEVYKNYLVKMASLVSWLLQKQYRIKIIISDIYPDLTAAADLMEVLKQMEVRYSEDQFIEPSIKTVDELVKELIDTDFVVASRFHSVLLAQRVIKPVIAISYQCKIDKLMEDTGQTEFCFPIDSFDVETVKRQFHKLEVNCETVKEQIARRSEEYRIALDEQYERIFNLI